MEQGVAEEAGFVRFDVRFIRLFIVYKHSLTSCARANGVRVWLAGFVGILGD